MHLVCMASIFARQNMNGTVTYRLQIRRKRVPKLNLTFTSREDAEEWQLLHEYAYIQDPYPYLSDLEKQRLRFKRQRKFA